MCDIGRQNADPSREVSPLVESINEGQESMALEDWLKLVEDLSSFSPKPLILLTGTEPFLYPDILALIKSIIEMKFSLHITTNGTLLSKYGPRIVDLCQSIPDIDITVSIDDIGQAHDKIRGVEGTFQKAIEGIRDTVKAREEKKQDFPSLNITCTVSDYNYKNLESFARWFVEKELKVESITFNHLWFKDASIVECHNRGYGKKLFVTQENVEDIDITAIDMALVGQQIRNIKKKYTRSPIRIHEQPELSSEEALVYYKDPCQFVFYDKCSAAWRNVAVTPKGNIIMSPLCFFPALGNVKEEPLSMHWNGEPFKKMRIQLKDAKAFPACARCCMLFGSKPKYYKIKSWI
jgi:MoaA/NifB/PqqE/SkfB family radical SAM enzyme